MSAVSLCAVAGMTIPVLAQPANNVCGANQATFTIPGAGGVVNGTTAASSVDGSACAGTGGDVYWYFTPSTSGPFALSLCTTTSAFDTVLSVHSGCPATTANTISAAACNDDSCGLLSDLPSVTLTAGVTYTVRVANYGGASGPVRLSVSAPLPPAQNNICATIANQPTFNYTGTGFTVSGSLSGATTDGWSNIAGGASGCADTNTAAAPLSRNDVWYRFTPSVSSNYNLTLCSSPGTWDSVLSVHSDCPDAGAGVSATLACNDDGVCSAGVGLSAITDVPLNAGVPVIIRVARYGAGAAASTDQFQLQVSSGPLGACCRADGSCALSAPASCTTSGDTYSGDGTVCATQVCTGACCNPTTGICTSTGPASCASPGVFQSVGTTCAPNPCPQPPAPANDECAGAIVVTPGIPAVNGFNNTATTGADETQSCVGDSSNGVWYSFTAPAAGSWQIDTNGTGFDTVLSAFDACAGTELDCDDDGGAGVNSLMTLSLSAGQSVRILVCAFGTGAGGAFTLNISTIITGACCNAGNGVCTVTSTGSAGCAAGTTYQGDNSVCAPNPCPQPPPPANDECAAAQALSLNVAVAGSNAAATGDGTEGPGGACYFTLPTNFSKAVWFTFTAPATDSYGITSCGSAIDTVVSVFDGTCAGIGSELGCDDDTCDGVTPPGSGFASIIAPVSMTAGQRYLIRLAVYTGAGATPAGGAFTITVTGTPVVGGGMCCRGATCNATVTQANCTPTTNAGASFVSSATACNLNGSLTTPCCHADYDKSGTAAVADIFAYINDWFASSPNAVIGGDGTGPGATVSNLFDWINAWFAGC
ncbi:MAG: hypothetical protein K2W85_10200 [Phycisphaerales bacterium]|nr:hypothetical protein [Phycisphaerales bacterium]